MRFRLTGLIAAVAMAVAAMAHAEEYPSHVITIVVGYVAGSGSDTAARIIGQHLSQRLGQAVVIDNRAGATGALASANVAHAKPDGYTLLLGTNSTHGSNGALYKKMPYDPIKDFAPVAHTGNFGYVLVVSPDLPVKSVGELVAYGKANPDKLSYATGSSSSLVMAETFARGVGLNILKVNYRSNPLGLTDVMAGRVSLMFVDISSGLSLIKAGSLRPLAVTTATRSKLMPNTPTIDETAVKGYDLFAWTGLYAPAGTPRAIADKLNGEVNAILAMPEVIERFTSIGVELKTATVDEFTRHTEAEVIKWTRLVKAAGIEPE